MSVSEPLSSANKPIIFGPYELMHRLGAGGMAETFFAVRRGLGGFEQWVCLKRILPAYEEDQEFVRLFLQEARVAARLRHSNIVQVIDFGRVDDSHYMALELVEGTDLKKLLNYVHVQQSSTGVEIGLGDRAAGYLGLCLAEALTYAHNADLHKEIGSVFHRDVSPSNVLVSPNGEVKLTDFGIAKAANQGQVTQTGVVKGKVPYLAPEYMRHGKYDARADLFSLGVMMYEVIVGQRPFDGHNELDTIARITEGRYTAVREKKPQTQAGLAEIVEQLIQADPEARFQSAAALVTALEHVVEVTPAKKELANWVTSYRAKKAKAEPSGYPGAVNKNPSHSGLSVKPPVSTRLSQEASPSQTVGEDSSVMSKPTRTAFGQGLDRHDDAVQQRSASEPNTGALGAGAIPRLNIGIADDEDGFRTPKRSRPLIGFFLGVVALLGVAGWGIYQQQRVRPRLRVQVHTPSSIQAGPPTQTTQTSEPSAPEVAPQAPSDGDPKGEDVPTLTNTDTAPSSTRSAQAKRERASSGRPNRARHDSDDDVRPNRARHDLDIEPAEGSEVDKSAGTMAIIKFKGPFKTMPIFLDGRRIIPNSTGSVTIPPGPHRLTYGKHGSQFRNFPAGHRTSIVITDG